MTHTEVHEMLSSDGLTDEGARHLAECEECRSWNQTLAQVRSGAQAVFARDVADIGTASLMTGSPVAQDGMTALNGELRTKRSRHWTQGFIAAAIAASLIGAVIVAPRLGSKPGGFVSSSVSGPGAHFTMTIGGSTPGQSVNLTGTVIFGRAFEGSLSGHSMVGNVAGQVIVIDGRGWIRSESFDDGNTLVTAAYEKPGLLELFNNYPPRTNQDRAMKKIGTEIRDGLLLEHWHFENHSTMGDVTIDEAADALIGAVDHVMREKRSSHRTTSASSGKSDVTAVVDVSDIGATMEITPPDDTVRTLSLTDFSAQMQRALAPHLQEKTTEKEIAEVVRPYFDVRMGATFVAPRELAIEVKGSSVASGEGSATASYAEASPRATQS